MMLLFSYWSLLARAKVRVEDGIRERDRTSQCLRTAVRPLATDFSGGKASEDSFTTSMTTLVEEYAVDIQLDSFWIAAPLSKV